MGTMPSDSEAMAVKAPTERSKELPLAHWKSQLKSLDSGKRRLLQLEVGLPCFCC